jgi:hypothetical protein
MLKKSTSTKKVQAKTERKKVRSSLNLDLDLSLSSAAIPLCVADAFGLVVFVDELLEFIEFGWSNVLKQDPECVLADPLHACVFDRDRFRRAGNDQSHTDHLAWVNFEVTIEVGATD